MINVCCRTNIDDYRGKEWPTVFACRPVKGDAVQAKCGAVLHIVGITHNQRKVDSCDGISAYWEPYLIIELHRYYPGLDTCKAK